MSKPTSVILSTEAINSYGTWLPVTGARLNKFKANPVMFYNHRTYSMLPIGRWDNIRIENNQIVADPVFDADPESQAIAAKFESGSIRGASIGADIISMSCDPSWIKPGQTRETITEYDVYEASLTPLPSNAECLSLSLRQNGILLADNQPNSLPILKTDIDMKQIALAVGLPEGATEAQILDKINAMKADVEKASKISAQLSKLTSGLDEKQVKIFTTLTKTDIDAAFEYLELCKTPDDTKDENKGDKKPERVIDLIKPGKTELGKETEKEDKESFAYLQEHDSAKLSEIRNTDPVKYQKMANDYLAASRKK